MFGDSLKEEAEGPVIEDRLIGAKGLFPLDLLLLPLLPPLLLASKFGSLVILVIERERIVCGRSCKGSK